MKETAKNYEDRIINGDFRKYLHGYGIDIGGGDDPLIVISKSVRLGMDRWESRFNTMAVLYL